MRNNQPCYCTHPQDCEYAKSFINKGEFNKIQKCKGRSKFVCCSQPEKIENLPPQYPKSKKFKALFKDKSFSPPLALKKIEYKCLGSLIAEDIVKTAAHCVNNKISFTNYCEIRNSKSFFFNFLIN